MTPDLRREISMRSIAIDVDRDLRICRVGFTLIELLVVIAIIAVLIALLHCRPCRPLRKAARRGSVHQQPEANRPGTAQLSPAPTALFRSVGCIPDLLLQWS